MRNPFLFFVFLFLFVCLFVCSFVCSFFDVKKRSKENDNSNDKNSELFRRRIKCESHVRIKTSQNVAKGVPSLLPSAERALRGLSAY